MAVAMSSCSARHMLQFFSNCILDQENMTYRIYAISWIRPDKLYTRKTNNDRPTSIAVINYIIYTTKTHGTSSIFYTLVKFINAKSIGLSKICTHKLALYLNLLKFNIYTNKSKRNFVAAREIVLFWGIKPTSKKKCFSVRTDKFRANINIFNF